MRAMVLVVLGGSLIYFVWSRVSNAVVSSARETGAHPTQGATKATGRLLSVSEMEAAIGEDSPAEPAGGAEESVGTAPAQESSTYGVPVVEAPRPEAVRGADQSLPLDWELGNPVAEGSLIVHEIDRLPDYLKGAGVELSATRKNLLFGFGLLIRGLAEHAGDYRDVICAAPDVTTEERELFLSLLDGKPIPASILHGSRSNPLLLGVRMASLEVQAKSALSEQRFREAAECYSSLLLAEIDAPWPADRTALGRWSAELSAAQARHRWDRAGEWPSIEVEAQRGDNLIELRKRVVANRPDLLLSTGLIARANQLGKYLQPGAIRIPTDPPSMLVDLGSSWTFYMHGAQVVAAWEVAIGREGKTTPGKYTVGEKLEDPPWFQQGRAPVPFGDPENPLGTRWISWEGSTGLGFHGTWEPETIGTAASEGCVRMRNADVEELFEILPRGASVEVRP